MVAMIVVAMIMVMMHRSGRKDDNACYSPQHDRDKLPEMLEPASTIDIACKMAGDLANVYMSEDTTGRESSHDESFEQRSKDIAKNASYWQTIFRSLKKST